MNKIILFILSFTSMFILVGCGDDDKDDNVTKLTFEESLEYYKDAEFSAIDYAPIAFADYFTEDSVTRSTRNTELSSDEIVDFVLELSSMYESMFNELLVGLFNNSLVLERDVTITISETYIIDIALGSSSITGEFRETNSGHIFIGTSDIDNTTDGYTGSRDYSVNFEIVDEFVNISAEVESNIIDSSGMTYKGVEYVNINESSYSVYFDFYETETSSGDFSERLTYYTEFSTKNDVKVMDIIGGESSTTYEVGVDFGSNYFISGYTDTDGSFIISNKHYQATSLTETITTTYNNEGVVTASTNVESDYSKSNTILGYTADHFIQDNYNILVDVASS